MHQHFIRSLAVHALLIASLFVAGARQTRHIRTADQDARDALARRREAERQLDRQAEEELIGQELKDRLATQIEELLSDELTQDDRVAFLGWLDRRMDASVDDALADAIAAGLTRSSYAQLEEQLTGQSFAQARAYLAARAEEIIMAEISEYISKRIAPALKRRSETNLVKRTGAILGRKLTPTLLNETDGPPATAGVVLLELEKRTGNAVTNTLTQTAIPNVGNQIMRRIHEALDETGWQEILPEEALRDRVHGELAASLAGHCRIDGTLAFAAARTAVGTPRADPQPDPGRLAEGDAATVNAVWPAVSVSIADSIRLACVNIVADLDISRSASMLLRKVSNTAARLASISQRQPTFRLGHDVWNYEDVVPESDGEGESHGEHSDSSHDPGGALVSGGGHDSLTESKYHYFTENDELSANEYARLNRNVYRRYRDFVAVRKAEDTTEPGDARPTANVAGETTEATAEPIDRPALIFAKEFKPSDRSSTDGAERHVPRPRFETLAFAVAEFQEQPLTIDGDVSDWGKLSHPIPMRWRFSGAQLKDGVTVYMRWSPDALYFCYRVEGKTAISPNLASSWEGDCLEVWIDPENLRRTTMHESPYTQQFCFMPFGYNGTKSHTFIEVGRGFRGFKMYENRLETQADQRQALGKAVGRADSNGYTVEAFVSRRVLARETLKAGTYLAANFSVNLGYDRNVSQQWSLPKVMQTFDKPDTWGDVLLLGTDGKAQFVDAADPRRPPPPVVPGEALGVRVVDRDMNTSDRLRDKVMAAVRVKNTRSSLYVILEETGPDSGVFLATFDTQPFPMPLKPSVLNVRNGDTLELVYRDTYTAYGEKTRLALSEVQMALPVLALQAGREP
ncbi:MAG: hypothetical protein HQ559_12450 [Lentisphaerae bacterium]|nr:hypothetical protein [Lentisphaerota bacterium]